MIVRPVALLLGLLGAILCLPGTGWAGTYSIGPGDRFATLILPNAWHVTATDRGLQAQTRDDEVYIWAEAYTEGSLDEVSQEHQKYYDDQGVVVTGKPQTKDGTVNGVPARFMNLPATWHGKKTILQYVFLDPGPNRKWKLMLSEWASPEGDKKYDADTNDILNSVLFRK